MEFFLRGRARPSTPPSHAIRLSAGAARLAWRKWHVIRVALGISDNAAQDFTAATACAGRALACDAENALALAVDALVEAWSRHDLDAAAEKRLAQALAANPTRRWLGLHSGIHARLARTRRRGGAMRRPRAVASRRSTR